MQDKQIKVFIDGSVGTTGLRIKDRLIERSDIELILLPEEIRKDAAARKDAIEKAELPVVFHSGFDVVSPDIIHCTAEAALEMIKRHKHLKAVFAHLGCNECWQDVYDLLAGIDGEVYFDTAFTSRKCPDDMMQRIICKHGADRILFASDMPWDSPALIREKILGLNISDDAKEKILGLNAQRLLGL